MVQAESSNRVVPVNDNVDQQVVQNSKLWSSPGAMSLAGIVAIAILIFGIRMVGGGSGDRQQAYFAVNERDLETIAQEVERRSASRSEQATQEEQAEALDQSYMRMMTDLSRSIERIEQDRNQEILTRAYEFVRLSEQAALDKGISPRDWLMAELDSMNRRLEAVDGVYSPMTGSGENQFRTSAVLKDRLALLYALRSIEGNGELAIAHDYLPSVVMVEEFMRSAKEREYQRELMIRMSLGEEE
ncbi:MAG: hypothetical protein AAGA75_17530 [Cyanobacteria bacterium P01_E01_bin.6]